MDFDDLLLGSVRLLKGDGRRARNISAASSTCWWMSIRIQTVRSTRSVRLLAGQHHNLCAVGDEDQSIYSWRGADINNILDFEKNFPEAKIIRLEQNYRSTQPILQAAVAVVANNTQRKGKNLWTAREGGSEDWFLRRSGWRERGVVCRRLHLPIDARGAAEGRESEGGDPVPHQLAIATAGRGSAPLRAEVQRGGRLQLLRARRNQGHDQLPEADPESRGLGGPDAGDQHSRARHWQNHHGDPGAHRAGDRQLAVAAMGEALDTGLLPPRACAALEAFREIIVDARAMLAGNFAERWRKQPWRPAALGVERSTAPASCQRPA